MRLKGMYEKRRDWERLIGILRTEAEGVDEAMADEIAAGG